MSDVRRDTPALREARIRARCDQIARRMRLEHLEAGPPKKPDPWVRSAVGLLAQILATVEEGIGIAGWHLEAEDTSAEPKFRQAGRYT